MSIYDIVMLVIFFGSVLFGYRKGLAWQIASLAAIVLSYFVAINFRNPVAQLISVQAPWNQFAAMLLLFLGTSLVVWTIYASASKSIKKMEMKGFDRQAGAILGVFKGAILCMLVTVFAVSLFGSTRNMVHNSATGHYVVSGIEQFSQFTPSELAQFLDPHIEQFRENIGGVPAKRDFFSSGDQNGQMNGQPQGGQFEGGFQNNSAGGFQNNQQASGQGTVGGFGQGGFSQNEPAQGQFQRTPNQFQNQNNFQTPYPQNRAQGQFSNAGFGQSQQYQQQPRQQSGGSFWQSSPNQAQNQNAPNTNGQLQPRATVTTGQNGWPQINTTIDTKELLQRGASTTADMLRRAYESANQSR